MALHEFVVAPEQGGVVLSHASFDLGLLLRGMRVSLDELGDVVGLVRVNGKRCFVQVLCLLSEGALSKRRFLSRLERECLSSEHLIQDFFVGLIRLQEGVLLLLLWSVQPLEELRLPRSYTRHQVRYDEHRKEEDPCHQEAYGQASSKVVPELDHEAGSADHEPRKEKGNKMHFGPFFAVSVGALRSREVDHNERQGV